METFGLMAREYRWLIFVLLLASASATLITSCGGGSSGGTNGEICDQCGDTDGPCISPAFIVPGANQPEPCPTAPLPETCVPRNLICRRGVDTAQQRCYPANSSGTDVDANFKCKGTRPGPTLQPATITPTPATPVPTATKTPDSRAVCGDGIIQGLEDCESGDFAGKTCASICGSGSGFLQCVACTISTSECTGNCPE